MTTHGSIHSCEVGVRWLARILGVLLVALVMVIALGEGMPNVLNLPGVVQAQFLALAFMVCGFVVGWRWETAGGVMALAGFALFCGIELMANGRLPGGAILLFGVPAALLLISHWLESYSHRGGKPV